MNKRPYLSLLITFLMVLCSSSFWAQETPSIRVRKSSNLAKAVFDNTTYQLVIIDRFGNPTEAKVLNYRISVKLKHSSREFEGHSNSLSPEAVRCLNGLSTATKIFFTEIKVQDEEGHLAELPDMVETWFPTCSNCGQPGKKH